MFWRQKVVLLSALCVSTTIPWIKAPLAQKDSGGGNLGHKNNDNLFVGTSLIAWFLDLLYNCRISIISVLFLALSLERQLAMGHGWKYLLDKHTISTTHYMNSAPLGMMIQSGDRKIAYVESDDSHFNQSTLSFLYLDIFFSLGPKLNRMR